MLAAGGAGADEQYRTLKQGASERWTGGGGGAPGNAQAQGAGPPHRGFSGAGKAGSGREAGPVQFERAAAGAGVPGNAQAQGQGGGADPFGLEQFMSQAKKGRKAGGRGTLDGIGKRGGMLAGSSGGGISAAEYKARGPGKKKMNFVSASGR